MNLTYKEIWNLDMVLADHLIFTFYYFLPLSLSFHAFPFPTCLFFFYILFNYILFWNYMNWSQNRMDWSVDVCTCPFVLDFVQSLLYRYLYLFVIVVY